jgi:hypothetical protein
MTNTPLISKQHNLPESRQAMTETALELLKHNASPLYRTECRRAAVERLFIQIVDCVDADKIGTTVSCHSTESSASGLRISTEEQIPAGSRIDLWVNISARPGKFFLSADVRWCGQPYNGVYQLGVKLIDGAATDTAAWQALHA